MADVGSSNGLERQPTCLFVQVIIGYVTAKAGAWGTSVPQAFIFSRPSEIPFSVFFPLIANFLFFPVVPGNSPLKLSEKWFIIPEYMRFCAENTHTMRGNDHMSASSKKKLRKEQEAVKLTEKQQTAQREAKKLNLYTTAFVAVLVILLVVAVSIGVTQTITTTGIREKNTVAVTIGDHEVSNAELNYYYMDAINNFYGQYGSYATMFGLDPTKALNEQIVDEASGTTWADDFLASAKESAAATYAMKDAADAAGFVLSEEQNASVDEQLSSLGIYAAMYGYADAESYLKAIYGSGASLKGYTEYTKLRFLADAYYQEYADSLVYEEADLRAAEEENFGAYSSYTYNAYYLAASKYLSGGTTDAEGNTTYSEEEKAASVEAAEADAKALMSADVNSVATLDQAIAALKVNEGLSAASTAYTDTLYANVNTNYADWISDADRKEGDMEVFANVTTSVAEDGTEAEVTNGYYVVYYLDSNNNDFALKNVRHILVSFAHDDSESEDHDHSSATYTDAEKAAAKATAEEILKQWESGDSTEESFAALANEKSADGDGTTGGLYENVYPGQMVTNFNDWTYDAARKAGDTGIVESNYGYHVMYFVSDSETTYRDYQIENQLRSDALNAWYTSAVDAMPMTDGDIKYIKMDLILQAAA